jgi:hypothetical protein
MSKLFSAFAVAILLLSACANPVYKFYKDQPYAHIKPVEGQTWSMCSGGKIYGLNQNPKSKLLKIPAGKKIVLMNYAYFSGYQVSYSCYPAIGFTPEENKTYVGDLMIGMTGCMIGLAEVDASSATNLSPVRSLSNASCKAE